MSKVYLDFSKDFNSNRIYFSSLINRINNLDSISSLGKDSKFIIEVLQADYYLSKVENCNSDIQKFYSGRLKEVISRFDDEDLSYLNSDKIIIIENDSTFERVCSFIKCISPCLLGVLISFIYYIFIYSTFFL